jgi:hypothetical protein
MRPKRTLVFVLAGAVLAAGLANEPAEAAPDKNKLIAAKYKKARRLYRQGKYEKAIRAFDEVKDLRYHPILDYGIANCYEALRDYNKAIYYLEKYVRNHAKHKMSDRHPKVADVKEKIKVLKRRAAGSPGPGPGPGPGTGGGAATGDPASGGGGVGAGAGTAAGDPVPGPDPYAVPPPPGGGTTGGVHGGGGGAPPPPGGHVKQRKKPARRSLIVSVDFGAASFAGTGQYSVVGDTSTGGGLFGSVAWRFIPWLAVGIHGGITAMDNGYCDSTACYEGDPLYFAVAALEAKGMLPLGPFDIWGSLGIGYGSIAQPLNDFESITTSGATLSFGVGADWFLSRTFSLGLLMRLYRVFPREFCDAYGTCSDVDDEVDPGVAWYAGLGVTWHMPLVIGRR